MRFVAVGDVMVDVVCSALPPPETRLHAGVALRAGGSAVNAAAAASEAGASAAVVGRVGTDAAAALVVTALEQLGVEALLAQDPELPTGTAVSLGADPSKPSVVASRGANARLSPDDIPAAFDHDLLFVSGFALFHRDSAAAALSALHRFSGAWAGIDLGSPALAAGARDLDLRDISGRVVVFATAEEARAATGEDPERAARVLASRFALACVKVGEDGAVVGSRDHLETHRAEPVVRRSPFGAGDAFAAVFLVTLATGAPLADALAAASAAGARAAGRLHGRSANNLD